MPASRSEMKVMMRGRERKTDVRYAEKEKTQAQGPPKLLNGDGGAIEGDAKILNLRIMVLCAFFCYCFEFQFLLILYSFWVIWRKET